MNCSRATIRLSTLAACFALLAALAVVVMPSSAGAQDDCYPDGCGTTTTTQAPPSPVCTISLEANVAGAEATATIANAPVGEVVRLLVDGEEVGRETSDSGEVVIPFDIPDLEPGDYSIVAVGVDFTVTCGGGGLEILGAEDAVNDPGGSNGANGSGGADGANSADGSGGARGALAFTGAEIAGIVALALALVAAGMYLVRRSRYNGRLA